MRRQRCLFIWSNYSHLYLYPYQFKMQSYMRPTTTLFNFTNFQCSVFFPLWVFQTKPVSAIWTRPTVSIHLYHEYNHSKQLLYKCFFYCYFCRYLSQSSRLSNYCKYIIWKICSRAWKSLLHSHPILPNKVFCNWPSSFSVPKRKTAFSLPELLFYEVLHLGEPLVGSLACFLFSTGRGRRAVKC